MTNTKSKDSSPMGGQSAPQLERLFELAKGLDPLDTAVVYPCDPESLSGALEAGRQSLINPVLIGPKGKIQATAKSAEENISGIKIIDVELARKASEKACAMAQAGDVGAIMKGSLHTDELLGAVIDNEKGLRTDRRMSHVFILDVPTYPRALLISDAAVNIAPDLAAKKDIVQNAIDCAHALGISEPLVAILAAVETVLPTMQATIDAAALAKMADRGQIVGGIIDGPLAFDNAVSEEAAETKSIESRVAGLADVLIAPDIEAGNMMAKLLFHLANAQSAGIVLGAKVPIMLTSRSDSRLVRLRSVLQRN